MNDLIKELLERSINESNLSETDKKSWRVAFSTASDDDLINIIISAVKSDIETSNSLVEKLPLISEKIIETLNKPS